jgi:hypothetical protein
MFHFRTYWASHGTMKRVVPSARRLRHGVPKGNKLFHLKVVMQNGMNCQCRNVQTLFYLATGHMPVGLEHLPDSSDVLLRDRRGWGSWSWSVFQTKISSLEWLIPPEYGHTMRTTISQYRSHFLQKLINTQTTCNVVAQNCPIFRFWPRWHCELLSLAQFRSN